MTSWQIQAVPLSWPLLLGFSVLHRVDQIVEDIELALLVVDAVEQPAAIKLEAARAGAGARQVVELSDKLFAAPGVPQVLKGCLVHAATSSA